MTSLQRAGSQYLQRKLRSITFKAKGGKQTLKRIIFGGALELVSRFF